MSSSVALRFETRDEWLSGREVGIGASESPAILGVSPYKSALQLYYEKTGEEKITRGEEEALYWGKVLERPIAERYARETGRVVVFDTAPFVLRKSTIANFMIATIDAAVTGFAPNDTAAQEAQLKGPGTLEIKNVSSYIGQRWTGPQEPPVEFMVQLQHQLFVTGDQWGSVAALIGGVMFVWADIPRDDQFIGLLLRDVEAFVQRVRDKKPPEVDASEHTREVLKRLYPRDEPITIQLPPDVIDLTGEYLRIKQSIKERGEICAKFENTLRSMMGNATNAVMPDGTGFTLKTRRGYDVKAHYVNPTRILKHYAPKQTKIAGRPAPPELTAGQEDAVEE